MFVPRNFLRPLTTHHGASLLEVLMAMVLVSVVILGIAGFSTVSIKGTAFSQELTIAVTLAQDALEEKRRVGYRPTIVGISTDTEPYGSIAQAPFYERTIITEANTPAKGLQTITVNVKWDTGAHSTSLTTIVAE